MCLSNPRLSKGILVDYITTKKNCHILAQTYEHIFIFEKNSHVLEMIVSILLIDKKI